MNKLGLIVLLTGLVPSLGGCNNGGSSATSPSVPLTTETFSGTIPVGLGNSDSHNFVVATAGEVDITLTAAGPPPTITMGLGIGNGSTTNGVQTCTLGSGSTSVPAQASTTAQLTGIANPGTLCVEVFDIGNALVDVTYTVTVAHP